MTGNKYEDKTGRTLTVANVDGAIALLNNGERVSVERLNDPNHYTLLGSGNGSVNENVTTHYPTDDSSYYNNLINKKSIVIGEEDNSQLSYNAIGDASQMSYSGDIVESHSSHLNKMGVIEKTAPNKPNQGMVDINSEASKSLLEKYNLQNQNAHLPQQNNKDIVPGSLEDILSRGENNSPTNIQATQAPSQPIPQKKAYELVFEKVKKTHSLKVNLKIDEKIPEKSVLKMLEENFTEESAIDYYANYVFNKLMEDPTIIKEQLKESIEKYVYKNRTSSQNDK